MLIVEELKALRALFALCTDKGKPAPLLAAAMVYYYYKLPSTAQALGKPADIIAHTVLWSTVQRTPCWPVCKLKAAVLIAIIVVIVIVLAIAIAKGCVLAQLTQLASFLNTRLGTYRANERAAASSSSMQYSDVNNVYDVDEGWYISLQWAPGTAVSSLSITCLSRPSPITSSSVMIETGATLLATASAQAMSNVLMALDMALFLIERLLLALLLQRTVELLENLHGTYGLQQRGSNLDEGPWLLLVQFREGKRKCR
ncbi:hypothetical protein EON64_02055 [archaeon]|nr:MAG: hypothetical protein EON64_02055 [archaeon]